jgi:threonylcarbamoyladenosine tRNA methylthiotransferase MtaB
MILKRMKRRQTRADAVRFTNEVRRMRPDAVFGADLIAGFPTETDAMAEQSVAIVDECGLTHLHIFPFSPRPGTPAARMPQVDGAVIHQRAARLRAKGAVALSAHLASEVGQVRRLLIENGGVGRTEQFTLAAIDGTPGTLVSARITGHSGRRLQATALAASEAA